MLGKFIAGDFIAIAGEMRRFPASNENTVHVYPHIHVHNIQHVTAKKTPQKTCVLIMKLALIN